MSIPIYKPISYQNFITVFDQLDQQLINNNNKKVKRRLKILLKTHSILSKRVALLKSLKFEILVQQRFSISRNKVKILLLNVNSKNIFLFKDIYLNLIFFRKQQKLNFNYRDIAGKFHFLTNSYILDSLNSSTFNKYSIQLNNI